MFSETVDVVLQRVGRPDLFTKFNAISYVNFTLKELSSRRLFYRDRVELSIDISSNTANSFIWHRPANFRQFATVKYYLAKCYPQLIPPGPQQDKVNSYYYGGPTYFVFNGVKNESTINVAYYQFPPTFNYYELAVRPAIFDRLTLTWSYLNPEGNQVGTLQTDDLNEATQAKVLHWLLFNWSELVEEGAMAKALKQIDDPRARSTFAVFRDMVSVFMASEPFEGVQVTLTEDD